MKQDTTQKKPRLVYFQYRYSDELPPFVLIHMREQVRCLAQWFDVTVVNTDADYSEICDRYEPDLTFFESSFTLSFKHCRKPQITNVKQNASVPKLGFLHSDGFSQGRGGFLSDMERLGIETFFSISSTAREHLPDVAERLYIWPTFADSTIFKNYGQWKSIPILFTGSKADLYPWRQQMIGKLTQFYPCLVSPHFGYVPRRGPGNLPAGEEYARLINSAWIAPACGTVAKDIVRKQFEIPASYTCLLTDDSPLLRAAGFIDMQNCVFVTKDTVLDKVNYLFNNPETLQQIINAGAELVHSRHTMSHRDQLAQWFRLYQQASPGQRIVQESPFSAMELVDETAGRVDPVMASGGQHLALLRQGDAEMLRGRYSHAKDLYLRSARYIPWMPEPQVRLSMCCLSQGEPQEALIWIRRPLDFTLNEYHAADPDPVEWTCLLLVLLCLGRLGEAVRRSAEYPKLEHPHLRRIRHILAALDGKKVDPQWQAAKKVNERASLHDLQRAFPKLWMEDLHKMLHACGQAGLSARIEAIVQASRVALEKVPLNVAISATADGSSDSGASSLTNNQVALPRSFKQVKESAQVKHLIGRTKAILYALESKFGYFLPPRVSSSRLDEFYQTLYKLARDCDVRSALVLGPSERVVEALNRGAKDDDRRIDITVLPIHEAVLQSAQRARAAGNDSGIANSIDSLKPKVPNEFDLLLINQLSSVAGDLPLLEEIIDGPRFIILREIRSTTVFSKYASMLEDERFVMTFYNPEAHNGYCLFERSEKYGLGN